MTDVDIKWMQEAIAWAARCNPIKESIPKVGAVIAIGETVLGRGRRGTGVEGDDEHAEANAIHGVKDKTKLPEATLYTTLEPCTKEARTNALECCTELIHQHKLRKIFIGILDPNQTVTGKGLWRLQDSGVEVELFRHDLVDQIRALNAAFIRSQQTLGATIITPQDGDTLKTYETQGKYTVRFRCLNPPGTDTYLISFREGLCWPQPGPFRQVEKRVWDIGCILRHNRAAYALLSDSERFGAHLD
jgi:pyrimidine deaminase RibD-like protein